MPIWFLWEANMRAKLTMICPVQRMPRKMGAQVGGTDVIVVAVRAERDVIAVIAVMTGIERGSANLAITEATVGVDLGRVILTSGNLQCAGTRTNTRARTSADTATSADTTTAAIVVKTAPTPHLSPGEILNVAETEKTTTADTDLRPLIRTQSIPRLLKCMTDLHTNTQTSSLRIYATV
jgi:hypothetical protein